MKTTQLAATARNGKVKGTPRQSGPGSSGGRILLSLPRTERSRIQWPTGQQMRDVSKHLARISREGIRRENGGDYFNSGDFAYRIQEIIRATDELLKKTQRP